MKIIRYYVSDLQPTNPHLSPLKTLKAFLTFLLLSPGLIFFSYGECFCSKDVTVQKDHSFLEGVGPQLAEEIYIFVFYLCRF